MDYILLSGGLDSTVLAAMLHRDNNALRAIYVNHGQVGSRKELVAADLMCAKLGMPLKVIDISGAWHSFSDVIAGRPGIGTSSAIALSAGLLLAVNWVAWAGGKTIALAIHKDDLTGRPWLLDLFSKYMEGVAVIRPSITGSPPHGNEFSNMRLEFPFKDFTKAEIMELGLKLGVDMAMTMTCQYDADVHCGSCYLCHARKAAFAKAGIADPTRYKV